MKPIFESILFEVRLSDCWYRTIPFWDAATTRFFGFAQNFSGKVLIVKIRFGI